MEGIHNFPQFIRKLFYGHDISKLNLDINLTQTNILMVIDSNKEKSMSELSELVGLEKSSFTRSIDYLVENNFLEKKYLPDDRRKINISFTEKGSEAVKLIKDDWNKYFESLLSGFSVEDKKEFSEAVEVVSKYINRIIKG
jgi:DNA-binding MarR family transcriptional regulator